MLIQFFFFHCVLGEVNGIDPKVFVSSCTGCGEDQY